MSQLNKESPVDYQKLRALRVYAELIGKRYNVEVVFDPSAQTASNDGKVITLPAVDWGNEEDLLLVECMIDHEAGVHSRKTDFELGARRLAKASPLVQVLANVFEDRWGETSLAAEKPGCDRAIAKGWEVLVKRGQISIEPPKDLAALLVEGLLYGLCAEVGRTCVVPHHSTRWDELENLIGDPSATAIWDTASEGIKRCASTSDAIDLAEEIERLLKSPPPPPPPAPAPSPSQAGGKSSSNPQGQEQEQEQDGQDPDQDPQGQGQGQGQGQDKPSEAEQAANRKKILEASKEQAGSGELSDVLSKALKNSPTAKQAEREGLTGGTGFSSYPAQLSGNPALESEIASASRPISNTLGAKLEDYLAAVVQSGVEWKATGRKIDGRKLPAMLTSGEVKIFKRRQDETAINTAVSIILDISGSMDSRLSCGNTRLTAAASSTRALGDVLDQFEVPFDVTFYGTSVTKAKGFDDSWRSKRGLFWTHTEGDTATHKAVATVLPEIAARQEERKLLVLVTDGEPGRLKESVGMLAQARPLGVEPLIVLVTSVGGLTNFAGELKKAGINSQVANKTGQIANAVFAAFKEVADV